MRLYEREAKDRQHYVNRTHELWEENQELKKQLRGTEPRKCEHDLRKERIDAWLDRVNTEARQKCSHGVEFAYYCEDCADELCEGE